MASETKVPMLAEFFILSLMRLDRDHYQRIEAVRSVTGDDMDHFLFAPNGELEDLILDYLGFPADGAPIKGGRKVLSQCFGLGVWGNAGRRLARDRYSDANEKSSG